MHKNIVTGPPVSQETMENTKLSMSQYMKMALKPYLDQISMIDAESGEFLTSREIYEKSYKVAVLLQELGCKKGSVIALTCENRFENPSILLATWHIGGICTFLNSLYSTDELKHAFHISQPQVVFASNLSFDKVQKVQKLCTSIQTVINIDTDDCISKSATELELSAMKSRSEKIDSSDAATILYSSGTTGLSKGVKLSHKSYIYLMEMYRTEKFLQYPKDNVVSGLLPMSHAYGLFIMISSLTLGHKYILMKRYSEKTFLNHVQKYRINTLYIVPAIISFLAKDPQLLDYDLSCVKCISTGGAPLRQETMELVKKRIKSCEISQHYGMTESTTMCLVSQANTKPDSTGKLVPGMMAKIVDINTDAILGPNETGELCIKGPLLMNGYCQNGQGYINGLDKDGWLHSGDLAYYDEDFNFYVVDRIKELIKYKSFQVPPQEIEMLLLAHEAIREAGVVGVPDEEAGELPRAYIVKKEGFDSVTEADLQKYVSQNISPPKRLRGGVIFVNELPKTATGKLSRKDLKKWAQRNILSI